MAYDPGRGMTVLAGGKDFQTYLGLSDVWDWDPTAGAWKQRLTGSEANLPAGRMYASLVTDSAQSLARFWWRASSSPGIYQLQPTPPMEYQAFPSAESLAIAARHGNVHQPHGAAERTERRWGHAMAFCPATGKTYVFGGATNQYLYPSLDEMWEWDGSSWSQVQSDVRPPSRAYAAMAYDPVRNSLIMYGGQNGQPVYTGVFTVIGDTWEWQSSTRKWSQLFPESSPGPQGSPGMVTDSGRGKVLLFGESVTNTLYSNSVVWEWDGASATWTNRTPVPGTVTPGAPGGSLLSFDDGRQKMFLFQGQSYRQGTTSNSVFWEWDPVSAGWALRNSGDFVDFGADPFPVVAYDSLRRRQVVPTNATDGSTTAIKTWELDANGPTWYLRDLSTGPTSLSTAAMAFDSQRGVMVLSVRVRMMVRT